MPLVNPVVIGGKIVGAYVDETFAIDGQGTATITELLQYILSALNDGIPPTANNGLNVDEGVIQMGGPLIETTNITNIGQVFKVGEDTEDNKSYFMQDNAGRIFVMHFQDATNLNYIAASKTGFAVNVESLNNDINCQIDLSNAEGAFAVANTDTGNFYSGVFIEETQIFVAGVRSYANTAAAQADSTFVVGGLYTIVGDPTVLRIKHT